MNEEFDIRDGVLYDYSGKSEKIVIPDTVRTISEKVFRGCETAVTIIVPDSVGFIDWGAFSFCPNLKELYLPASLWFISVSAIEKSVNLKKIIIDEKNENYYVKGNCIYSKNDETYVVTTELLK